MEFEYKKSLGQNFIYDVNYLTALVKKINVQPTDVVLEVGAGAGTLTEVLAKTDCKVCSIEIDQRLANTLHERLHKYPNVEIIFADALKYDYRQLPPFRLIANVPYYITTPLIMQFLSLPNCLELNVLVANEVAERIVASSRTSLYGALSISCQLQAACHLLQFVPRTLFTPQPKIDSAFICLKKYQTAYDHSLDQLLKSIFAARRKTILNALSGALNVDKTVAAKILSEVNLAPTLRPEQITPTEYAKISEISHKYY